MYNFISAAKLQHSFSNTYIEDTAASAADVGAVADDALHQVPASCDAKC
jgi:hypothetical protein